MVAILKLGGTQRIGKSTFVRWLCPLPEYFREGPIRPDSKDEKIRLTDIFIQEVPELGSSTRRSDVEAFKDHVTRKEVVERPAFGKGPMRKPAVCSFLATVNIDGVGFLTDSTGSSRFLISEVQYIDFELFNTRSSEAMWIEALWFYNNHYRIWELSPEEAETSAANNAKYQIVNALDPVIDYLFEITHNPEDFIPTIQIRNFVTPHYRVGNENGFARELARTLKARGLSQGKTKYAKGKPHLNGWKGIKKRDVEELS